MEKVTRIVVDPKERLINPTLESLGSTVHNNIPSNLRPRSSKTTLFITLLVIALGLGVGTGFVVAKKAPTGNSAVSVQSSNSVQTETEAGINDETAFPDSATGVLLSGGLRGEGTHHLDRSATNEKEVALSSTVINLDNFVGKKVEVKGQTISSKTSGWLMDVGKIKIIK